MLNHVEIFNEKIRAKILHHFIKKIKKNHNIFNYLEIGTAFSLDEGMSTLLAAWSIDQYFNSGNVTSVDISEINIKKSKEIIQKYSPDSIKYIQYHLGTFKDFYFSNKMVNEQKLNLTFIDGSGDAMINLIEFDTLLNYMHDSGIIIVDDVRFMKKTSYRARRDFGKASLIYPLLLISENLEYFKNSQSKSYEIVPNFLYDFFSDSFINQKVKKYAAYEFIRVESLLVVFKKGFANEYLPNISEELDYFNLKFSSIEDL